MIIRGNMLIPQKVNSTNNILKFSTNNIIEFNFCLFKSGGYDFCGFL